MLLMYIYRMKTFKLLFLTLSYSSIFCQSKDEVSIRIVLDQQTKAWNLGQIEAFMDGYLRSDSLMFIGKSGITYGWNKTLDKYKKGYPDTAAMGKLDFSILQVRHLCQNHFFVVGRWHLARTIGDLSGVFTLVFKKIKNSWLIIADHSS